MVINCFWVSGQYKGKGNGKRLLQQCIDDAKAQGMDGVVAISSDKKRPFMSEPMLMEKAGTGGALFRNLYRVFLKKAFVCNLCRPKKAVVFSFLQS